MSNVFLTFRKLASHGSLPVPVPVPTWFFFSFSFFLKKKKSFNYEIKKKKKPKQGRFEPLMENTNRALTEGYIEKNWKLEDWNDKTES